MCFKIFDFLNRDQRDKGDYSPKCVALVFTVHALMCYDILWNHNIANLTVRKGILMTKCYVWMPVYKRQLTLTFPGYLGFWAEKGISQPAARVPL